MRDYVNMPQRDVVEFAHRLYNPSMIDHGAFGGQTDDDHTQYVMITPSSANRNLLQSADDFTPLILRNSSTQSTAVFVCQNSTGGAGFQIESDFDIVIGDGTAGKDYTITFNGETSDGTITWMEDEGYFLMSDPIRLTDTAWDDLRVSMNSLKVPAVSGPGFQIMRNDGSTSPGVYTYWFDKDSDEQVWFDIQMPHAWKEGTDISPHVHWTVGSTSPGKVVWGLEYTWANINAVYGNTTVVYTPSSTTTQVAYTHNLAAFADISGSGMTLSSILMCRFFRAATSTGDNYAADAALLSFDLHYQIDAFGSDQEYVK